MSDTIEGNPLPITPQPEDKSIFAGDQNPGQAFNIVPEGKPKYMGDENPWEHQKTQEELIEPNTLYLWERIQYEGQAENVLYCIICSVMEQNPDELKIAYVQDVNGQEGIGGLTPTSNQPINSSIIPLKDNTGRIILTPKDVKQLVHNYYAQYTEDELKNKPFGRWRDRLLASIDQYDKGPKKRHLTDEEWKISNEKELIEQSKTDEAYKQEIQLVKAKKEAQEKKNE